MISAGRKPTPQEELDAVTRAELETAVYAARHGSKVYESLQNLNEVIGTQYGDRVLYELIQNAHDAHRAGEQGQILIKLIVRSASQGCLFVANGGTGFKSKDVEAIRNLATSAKEIGEGIGNKGLGFRSVEALTDDVCIYSQKRARRTKHFDGYRFRFASAEEIEELLRLLGAEAPIARQLARSIPRYLVPRPLHEQSDEIKAFARRGYATVIAAPLRSSQAVKLATEQVRLLADLEAPLLLFLDRIAEIRIEAQFPGPELIERLLLRDQTTIGEVPSLFGCRMYEVNLGEGRRFLVVRRELAKERVLESVGKSIPRAPQLKRWLRWKGQPAVSIAIGLFPTTVSEGRLYNFLPMGKEARPPLLGYVDAPFFADIDRRNADFNLPLNEMFMEAAAEACVSAALTIAQDRGSVWHRAVFDLIAWTGDHAPKIDKALKGVGSSLREAPIIPAIPIEGRKDWANLSEISLWPNGGFSVLRPADVGRQVGARFVSPELDELRLSRLKEMARRIFRYSLTPTDEQLAAWAEAFAQRLIARSARPATWSRFYEDLKRLFEAASADLTALSKRLILYDRTGKLLPARGCIGTSQGRVYVRVEASKVRSKDLIPLPPSTLIRRYCFLHEGITFHRETLAAFIKADIVREYDPVTALTGLKSALGGRANEARRREALLWSFHVWRTAGAKVEDALRSAELYVPTLSGWQPAVGAAFSSSWTTIGRILENYCVESASISSDCRQVRDRLLVGQDKWPRSTKETKQQWISFLELIGVTDGLRPVPGCLTRIGRPAYLWLQLVRRGQPLEGLDNAWCAEARNTSFNYPYTSYRMKGEAWRFPGQVEHDQLAESSKEAFCSLVFSYLQLHGDRRFCFYIGRFDRAYEREWDTKRLPTPLATFLRAKKWVATNTRDGLAFRRPNECWAARGRRGGPPRFVDRVPEATLEIGEAAGLAKLLFSEVVGLQDWQSKESAVARLRCLATIVSSLSSNDRPTFRREYQRAWLEVVETGTALPNDLSLVVARSGQLEVLSGSTNKRPNIIVTQDAQRFEARTLSSAGHAVLEVGEVSPEQVVAIIQAAGAFVPRRLDNIGVRLLVDGDPFAARATDPPLTTLGLDWLPEVAVIGHEIRGEQLERAILSSTVERRVRSIRVRRCDRISLVIEGEEVAPAELMAYHAFEDEHLPTLILTNPFPLNWTDVARSLSGPISRLIDSRLRSLEPLLLKLALDRTSDELDSPSDDNLARALDCSVDTIRDHRAGLRSNLEHTLRMLTPVIGYYKGIDLAKQFRDDADRAGMKFNLRQWVERNLIGMDLAPAQLLSACEQSLELSELRRRLALNYARLNSVPTELGEPVMSNEVELRQLYSAYLGQMRPAIIERLRRHYYDDFRKGRNLATYVERKSLEFLPFDAEWVFTREFLEMESVERYVCELLDETLGPDVSVELLPIDRQLETNRKMVREFAELALPVIRAWCRKYDKAIPQIWQRLEPQSIVRLAENSGLLDFDAIAQDRIPTLCMQLREWPDGMAETIDQTVLNLSGNEVKEEEMRREQQRTRIEIERRSITFGGTLLDTADVTFAEKLGQLAEDCLSKDETWFDRSRQRVRLADLQSPGSAGTPGRGSSGGGMWERERQLSESQRGAMGLISEWLSFQFLRRRHGIYVNETCWVSGNRAQFFGGHEGNDAAGYDFLVATPHANWLYEVKSSIEDSSEFELTANELRVASSAAKDGRRRYRILYVPYAFSPEKWYVLELPNPMGDRSRGQFQTIGRGSVRIRFERH
jgi:hypothetical protein